MINIKERKEKTEELNQEISFDNFENKHEFPVSNEEILDTIDSKLHENHLKMKNHYRKVNHP